MKTIHNMMYVILLGATATVGGFAQQTNMPATLEISNLYIHVFNGIHGIGTNDLTGTYIPPLCVLSTKLAPDGIFEHSWGGGGMLLGRIETHDGKCFLRIPGGFGGNHPDYYSEIELEKPFSAAAHPMREAVNPVELFVLSTNSDYKPFLERYRTDAARALAPRLPDPRFK
jgi:hypothetical protein